MRRVSKRILRVAELPTNTVDKLWTTVNSTALYVDIPGHPPSINHTYGRGYNGRVFKKKVASQWEDIAGIKVKTAAVKAYGTHDLSSLKGRPIALEIYVYRKTWKGKTKATKDKYVRPDLTNFIKLIEDSVCRGLGLDDSAVVEVMAFKTNDDGPEKVGVYLNFVNEEVL